MGAAPSGEGDPMRGPEKLHPTVRARAEALIAAAKTHFNLDVQITETLRTESEQAALYAQGRKSLSEVNALRRAAAMAPISEEQNRSKVTKASTAADSFHGYGLAFDIVIRNGRRVDWSESCDWNADGVGDWGQVGGLAEQCGLEWGGNWTSFPDLPHFQAPLGWTIPRLKAEDIPPGQTIRTP
jgi:peptidoglycan L-alanyl-D-glutamate endopeptidase CwlK